MNSRIFCTFSPENYLEETLSEIQKKYAVLYGKIYVLYTPAESMYLSTYNVDMENMRGFPRDTILVHRKKQSKTLYTINALNLLVSRLNGGAVDPKFQVNWEDYRDSILLTRNSEFMCLKTQLKKVVEV